MIEIKKPAKIIFLASLYLIINLKTHDAVVFVLVKQ